MIIEGRWSRRGETWRCTHEREETRERERERERENIKYKIKSIKKIRNPTNIKKEQHQRRTSHGKAEKNTYRVLVSFGIKCFRHNNKVFVRQSVGPKRLEELYAGLLQEYDVAF